MEFERNALRLSPDEWIEAILADPHDVAERDRLRDPVENLQWDLAQAWLPQGHTVILENGFWAEEERTAYAARAANLGAFIELHFLQVAHDELWRRVVARNAVQTTTSFVMTREEMESYWAVFQPPTAEELAFYDVGRVVRKAEKRVRTHNAPQTRPPSFG